MEGLSNTKFPKSNSGVEAEQGGKSKKHDYASKINRNRHKEIDLATGWRAWLSPL
jgi:hypothetical protein